MNLTYSAIEEFNINIINGWSQFYDTVQVCVMGLWQIIQPKKKGYLTMKKKKGKKWGRGVPKSISYR